MNETADPDPAAGRARVAVAWETGLEVQARQLAAALSLPLTGPDARETDLLLTLTPGRLELRVAAGASGSVPGPISGPVYADFVAGRADYRRKHGGGRNQPLARAVGLKGSAEPSVIDATAGLGRDAFVLASLGAKVVMLERSGVVGALLQDALRRAHADPVVSVIAARMQLVVTDAVTFLDALSARPAEVRPEVVYLDPMYPHTNKTALQKKEMQLFRAVVGTDDDAAQLLAAARRAAGGRVVVKRPLNAPFLADAKPSGKVTSKNTRFDLYLK